MDKNPMLSSKADLMGDTLNRIGNRIPIQIEEDVEKIIEKEHEKLPKGLGYCYVFWNRKKELLKEKGYDWSSPADQNKHIIY